MMRSLHFLAALTLFFVVSSLAAPASFAQAGKADYYLGLDLYHEKDYEGSAKAFQQQLSKTPDDTSAQRWLSKALEKARLSREEQLAPKAEPAPAKPAASFATEYERGVALYRDGQYAQAQLAFEKHLKDNPKHVPSRQWLALLDAHTPTVDPKTLLDRSTAKEIAAKNAAQPQTVPAVPPAAASGGNPQFGMEQKPVLALPAASPVKPISFGEKLKSIGIGKPKAAAPTSLGPVISPAAVQPPAPSSAEIERLRRELDLRNEQIRRAIVQTKRAIAQTDEAETLNVKLGAEIEALRKREAEISSELEKKKSELTALLEKQSGGKKRSEPKPNDAAAQTAARSAAIEKGLREEIARLSLAKNGAVAAQKAADAKLDAAAKAKAESDKELERVKAELASQLAKKKSASTKTVSETAKALEKKEAELLKLRQDASAAQRQFDIRFGQLERTLQNAQARAAELDKEKSSLEARAKSLEAERAASEKKLAAESGAAKAALQKRVEELSKLSRGLEAKLAEKTAEAAQNAKAAQAAAGDRKALETAKASLEAEIKRRNEQIKRSIEQTRLATAEAGRLEKELAASEQKLEASAEDLKRSAIELEKTAAEKKRIEAGVAALESEKARLAAELESKETELAAARRESASAKSRIEDGLKVSEKRQAEIAAQLRSAEQNLARVAASYQASEDARLDAERRAVENGKRGKDVAIKLIAREKELSEALATEEALRRTIAGFDERLAREAGDREALEAARLAAEQRAEDAKAQAGGLEAQIRALRDEREAMIERVEQSGADLEAARARLAEAQSEIESIRRQSEDTAAALEAELAESAKKLEIASQARRSSDERAEAMRAQFEEASQALEQSERALGFSAARYQESEEARFEAERKLAQSLENTQALAEEIRTLRDSETRILSEIQNREQALEALRADFEAQSGEIRSRAERSESALREVSARFQEAEQGRAQAEARLGRIARERGAIESELSELRSRAAALESELERRDAAYAEARAELAAISDDAARERAEAASQLSHLETVLEESRAQGILLANHLERERALRRRLETRVAEAESNDSETRAQIENLRNQLNHTLPQLQAMNASLDEISVTTEVSEGAFDE